MIFRKWGAHSYLDAIYQSSNGRVGFGLLGFWENSWRALSIAQLIVDHSIEFTIATPSEYLMLTAYASDTLRRCSRWKYMCSGGESITDALLYALGRLELPNPILIDCYGPTEVSCATTLQITPLNMVLNSKIIGGPIENTSIYILDRAGTALPVGLPGEICVSGLGLAQYLDADLNIAKFVPNPYATTEDVRRGFTTVYKTGDRGCLRDDGLLVYLGRLDNHGLIKLRGQRIELDEVNNAIRSFGQGKFCDVAVTVRGQPEFLVAHVVYAAGGYMNQWELDKLRSELPLPRYMIPSVIIPIERLPTTARGKVDHNAVAELPLPEYVPDNQTSVLTVPEGEVRIIWKEVLGSEAGRVTIRPNTDFFSVGGNSLLLVRLQHTLKEKLAVQVPLQQLYQASSLQNMAALISEERSSLPLQPVDWEVETAIPPRMLASLGETVIKRRDENCQVLLTAALGFLGSEVLAVLLADSRITKVHCIAIPEGFSQQIMHHEKVVIYSGSLTSHTLGLSRREIGLLGGNVDRIIHAGAQGHCLNSYQSVRDANCGSMQFLAELALPRRIPFHFISSGPVILQSGAYSTPSKSMAMHPPSSNGLEGFTVSKWASECFLEKLSHQTGLPVVIHRPCSLVGDRAPHDDAMNSVIRFSMLNRMVPDVPSAKGFFEFKQATEVAAEIAHAATTDKGIVFCHHSSGVKVPFSQLAERMEALYGGKFQTVSMPTWLSKANEKGIKDVIVSYLEANFAANAELKFPFLGEL